MGAASESLTTAFDETQSTHAYPEGIEFGYWSLARNRMIVRALKTAEEMGLIGADATLLEVGCGPGLVVQALRQEGFNSWGAELGRPQVRSEVLSYVKTGVRAQDLPENFRDDVDAVMLFDVIEHIEEDSAFLSSLKSAFPNAKVLILTVPAGMAAWSNYDEYYGHYRRYGRNGLNATVRAAGMRPVMTRSFFSSLYAAACVLKGLKIRRSVELKSPQFRPLHRLLAAALDLENRIAGPLGLPGLSLITVCAVEADRRHPPKG
ncbi:MAG: methyltransferase domain-containing protein [Pseudomonadota bacterium]